MHPHECQLTIGWLGYSYCNDTDSLFQECKNRFANFHLSTALQVVGLLAFLALCLTAVWALAMALTFLKLLGKDPEDAVKLHAKYSRFYHPYHGFNWLLPVVTILLCVPGFEISAWAAIHAKDSNCTYASLVFDPGQIFCVTAVSLILVVIPRQHWLLTRLTGRLPMQMHSQMTSTIP
jgi:hypothetical protein